MSKRQPNQPIRVLIVEDSRTQRELLVRMLQAAQGFEVAGTASNGAEAVDATRRLHPDVIAMDINLPVMDGYEATKEIMHHYPTPVVMISSDTSDDERRSMQALAAGALAVLHKPQSLLAPGSAGGDNGMLLRTLRLMADVHVVTRYPTRQARSTSKVVAAPAETSEPQIVAIAASTGGPAALQMVLSGLGADFPLPILVAQHITPGFTRSLAEWLNTVVPLPVQIATPNQRLAPGHIYLAPDEQQLSVGVRGYIALRSPMPLERYCPSADVLFHSVAGAYGARALGVVLTGMGDDGAAGLLALRTAGSYTLAQDEASCVVYGMPRAAVALGAVIQVEPLATMGQAIKRQCTQPLLVAGEQR